MMTQPGTLLAKPLSGQPAERLRANSLPAKNVEAASTPVSTSKDQLRVSHSSANDGAPKRESTTNSLSVLGTRSLFSGFGAFIGAFILAKLGPGTGIAATVGAILGWTSADWGRLPSAKSTTN